MIQCLANLNVVYHINQIHFTFAKNVCCREDLCESGATLSCLFLSIYPGESVEDRCFAAYLHSLVFAIDHCHSQA